MNLTIGTTETGKFFSWPAGLEAVTQTFAILAKKGKGKSYTASVTAEEMLKAGQQIIVLDPTGAWFGLQSSSNGKKEGFPIVVFGGDHANVPLEQSAGEIIAQAIVDKRFSAILDLSLFRKNESNRFVASFLETLYRINREPVHLFVDEADAFAPQRTFSDEARTLGAMEDIVRRGRKRGIGTTLITQRPAVINKNVLTQCEVLIALGLSHPKDIDAIQEWVNVHADDKQAKIMIGSLPSLPIGNAWIWSPGWGDIFERVKIRERETFDSGATPKAGEKVLEPKKLAPIDIEVLGKAITDTIERKKAEDPRELRKKIAELEKNAESNVSASAQKATHKEIAILKDGQLKRAEALAKKLELIILKANEAFSEISAAISKTTITHSPVHKVGENNLIQSERSRPQLSPRPAVLRTQNADITKPQQRILDSLAWLHACRIVIPNRNIVAYLSDQSPLSSGFSNNLGALRSSGYIEYPMSGKVVLTFEGLAVANQTDAPISPEELHQAIYSKLPNPQCNILRVLIAHYGKEISKESLAETAGQSSTSSGYSNNLGALRSLGLIDYPRPGFVIAKPVLMLEDIS